MIPHDTALAIFAKLPEAGRVKTRLNEEPIPEWGTLSSSQAADVYKAFLEDYSDRFTDSSLSLDAFFCVRPGTDISAFQSMLSDDSMSVVEEPTWEGKQASTIGEAMSFTIKNFLAMGYKKVIILGSDLPHLPDETLLEAQQLLATHPLVLGDDGGGCYLVSASEPPDVLESSVVVWSKGRDFSMLCAEQERRGQTVGVLSETWVDIDRAADLHSLCKELIQSPELVERIPHTFKQLQSMGLV